MRRLGLCTRIILYELRMSLVSHLGAARANRSRLSPVRVRFEAALTLLVGSLFQMHTLWGSNAILRCLRGVWGVVRTRIKHFCDKSALHNHGFGERENLPVHAHA